jgi:hypothetical protein
MLEVFDEFRRVDLVSHLRLDERREAALIIFSAFLFNRVNQIVTSGGGCDPQKLAKPLDKDGQAPPRFRRQIQGVRSNKAARIEEEPGSLTHVT